MSMLPVVFETDTVTRAPAESLFGRDLVSIADYTSAELRL